MYKKHKDMFMIRNYFKPTFKSLENIFSACELDVVGPFIARCGEQYALWITVPIVMHRESRGCIVLFSAISLVMFQ